MANVSTKYSMLAAHVTKSRCHPSNLSFDGQVPSTYNATILAGVAGPNKRDGVPLTGGGRT
jgi:hypothetical protein